MSAKIPLKWVRSNRKRGTGPELMTSYLRPWAEVAYLAEQHCQNPRPPIGRQECLIWEERGYWAMHGNFAMPEQIAAQSKAICTTKSNSFRSQALCMHNESKGYKQFSADSEMPAAQADAARADCKQKLKTWSQRGSCMISANFRFKYPNGRECLDECLDMHRLRPGRRAEGHGCPGFPARKNGPSSP